MYRILLIAIVVAGLAACSQKTTSTPSARFGVKGLMPLAVGNRWNYKRTFYDSATGNASSTGTEQINIVAEIIVNDTAYFQQTQNEIPLSPGSFFSNVDTNTVIQTDSANRYTFFKRTSYDAQVSTWPDTVTRRCPGHNVLTAYAGDATIGSYPNCLKNIVLVNDCTGQDFEKWVYYLKPAVGLVRVEHYKIKNDNTTWYPDFTDDLTGFIPG